MKAFFVAIATTLPPERLAAGRRQLARLLAQRGIDLVTLKAGRAAKSVVSRLASEARGAPVVAIDDSNPFPDKARWLAELTGVVLGFPPPDRPQLVYVTHRLSAETVKQAGAHPVVRFPVARDDRRQWVRDAAEAVFTLAAQLKARMPAPPPAPPSAGPEIIGTSPCFREAVDGLGQVLRSPYGFVTGEAGVGKLFLIRAVWRQLKPKGRLFLLPCGSFFKDYYVAGFKRRVGGGRAASEQLWKFIDEAEGNLLVLHHVEKLPTSLQEELEAHLDASVDPETQMLQVLGVDADGIVERAVRIVATSTHTPEYLEATGLLIRPLALFLKRRHVRIPTLAERGPQDVRLLCENLMAGIAERQGLASPPRLERAVVRALDHAAWPNNTADLVRVMEYAIRQAKGGTIRANHLPKTLADGASAGGVPTLDEVLDRARRCAIENALELTGGDVPRAAKMLGRNRHALYRLMARLKMGTKQERRGARYAE